MIFYINLLFLRNEFHLKNLSLLKLILKVLVIITVILEPCTTYFSSSGNDNKNHNSTDIMRKIFKIFTFS